MWAAAGAVWGGSQVGLWDFLRVFPVSGGFSEIGSGVGTSVRIGTKGRRRND